MNKEMLERLIKILTPISKVHGGDYNTWMHKGGGSKKDKIPLVEAHVELRKILSELEELLSNIPNE